MIGTLLLGAASLGLAAQAAPQADDRPGLTVTDGRQVYEPVFFDRFAPQTVADMLFQVPGFTVREGGGGRGFGQGGTNVLIDGQRVSGKETGPVDLLRRTPASNLLRIEIVDGAALGIPGLTGQVADIYLSRTGLTGSWEWSPTFRQSLEPALTDAQLSVNGEVGGVTFVLGVENDSFARGNAGPELLILADGTPGPTADEDFSSIGERPSVTLSLGWNGAEGDAANLNASYERFYVTNNLRRQVPADVEGMLVQDDFRRQEEEWNAEVSGDYATDALGGRLKLIGLQYLEHSPVERVNLRSLRDPDAPLPGSYFDQVIDEGESILRAELAWLALGGTVEAAAEGAFNFLEAEDVSGTLTPEGDRVPEGPLAFTRVEELRGQASLAYGGPMGPFDLSASLGLEVSEISVPSGETEARTFLRPRGFVSLAYDLDARTDLRLRAERLVGQLNFFDFVSSVDFNDANETAGNPDVVPQQSWLFEGQAERRFGPQSQVTLRAFYEAVEDRVDLVPLAFGGEGPGNIESATAYGASVVGSLGLVWAGVPGGLIDYDASVRWSELEDPFTAEFRRFSDDEQYRWSVDFRQDVPDSPYAWGFGASDFQEAPSFRSDQLFRPYRGINAYAFAEHRNVFGMQANLRVGNLFDVEEGGTRFVYEPGSRRDLLLASERQVRTFGRVLSFSLSDTF